MRAGEIIDCPHCGSKHELTLARITETVSYENGIKSVTKRNDACKGLLFYGCGVWPFKTTYLAAFDIKEFGLNGHAVSYLDESENKHWWQYRRWWARAWAALANTIR